MCKSIYRCRSHVIMAGAKHAQHTFHEPLSVESASADAPPSTNSSSNGHFFIWCHLVSTVPVNSDYEARVRVWIPTRCGFTYFSPHNTASQSFPRVASPRAKRETFTLRTESGETFHLPCRCQPVLTALLHMELSMPQNHP